MIMVCMFSISKGIIKSNTAKRLKEELDRLGVYSETEGTE